MPITEAQKRTAAKWREKNKDRIKELRESNKEYFKEYYQANKVKMDEQKRISRIRNKTPEEIERLKSELSRKQELIAMYEASRAQDSPITTDEDSNWGRGEDLGERRPAAADQEDLGKILLGANYLKVFSQSNL